MPPTTRRSQAASSSSGVNSGVAKKVTRKRAPAAPITRKESDAWNFVGMSNGSIRESVEQHHEVEEESDEEPLAIDGPADVRKAVGPLREMADKVGKEVEQFAATLDTFLHDLPTRQDKYKAAMEVVMDFKTIAEEAVRQLQINHQKERMQQLKKEWSRQAQLSTNGEAGKSLGSSTTGVLSARKVAEVEELRQWQQEADIWELFRLVLELHYGKDLDAIKRAKQQEREEKLAQLEQPHRYTTEAELYERFLIENDMARERSLIKKWLEQAVDHQESDVQGIMEELEARSGNGKGLWSQGWLNTREKIKGEKRLRTWPSPSDSVQPQIRTSAGDDMLVTTLDPDAPSRQQRSLEKPDRFYEKAMWIACWEMLRRGKPWDEIMKWCEERNEGWRAVALGAMSMADPSSNGVWRKMCYLASESTCSSDYEAAVYGLLGGNVKAVAKVCHTIDDHLYAYYNGKLVRHFEQYLRTNYPDRSPSTTVSRGPADEVFEDADKSQDEFDYFIKKLRKENTQAGSVKPLKIIQSYLLNNATEDLIYTAGQMASYLDQLHGGDETESIITRVKNTPSRLMPEAEVLLDKRALRIAAHIYVVIRALDPDEQDPKTVDADENVVVSYIQNLRAAGARDYAPLYSSRLQRTRYCRTMGRVLQDVSNVSEQRELLSLMQKEFEMDVVQIFHEQLSSTLNKKPFQQQLPERPLSMLEETEVGSVSPGQRIMADFMPETLDEVDMAIVKSLQWFEILRGEWQVTFSALSLALRKCLMHGRVGCAIEIVRNFPYDSISYTKSEQVIRKPVNMMDKNTQGPEEGTDAAVQWELMRRQSRTYFELEQIVHAISALAEWVAWERDWTSEPRASNEKKPPEMQEAKEELDEAMAPLLQGILRHPMDEAEAADLWQIRKRYLPEIVIAYNTALYAAGATLSRDAYIQSMDLSVTIADETNGLVPCFVHSGRMQELVTGLAQASKMMLIQKEANNRVWKGKGTKEGKDLGMWEIVPQGRGALAAADIDVS